VAMPFAETSLLGGWLMARAGVELDPDNPVTAAPGLPGDSLRLENGRLLGRVSRVPAAHRSPLLLAVVADEEGTQQIVGLRLEDARLAAGANVAGEPRFDVIVDARRPAFAVPAPAGADDEFRARGALSRVAMTAGALEAVTDLTIRYTKEREQFGGPIGRFQAVQQHVVSCAQGSELVRMACWQAVAACGLGASWFEIAAAKVLACEEAMAVARASHQAHGAIGYTREYALHRFTTRLWSWAAEYGDAGQWSAWLGEKVAEHGADGLYPLITAGSGAGVVGFGGL